MKWGSEVAHIMRKDVRELRWVIAGYLIALALATVNARGLFSGHTFPMGMLFVIVMGMLLLASFVQSDSPTRPDAFWAIHPQRPSAVMFSKLALAGGVILIPALIGQYAALSPLDIDVATAAPLLAASAGIFGAWLVFAFVVSAITPDIRTFILVAIAASIGLLLGLFFDGPMISVAARAGACAAGVMGALILLALLYRTRDSGTVRGSPLSLWSRASLTPRLWNLPARLRMRMRSPRRRTGPYSISAWGASIGISKFASWWTAYPMASVSRSRRRGQQSTSSAASI